MNAAPIGVFDSGLGGLTVAKEIINRLPEENIVYLGDTARVPYGTRTNKTIRFFAKELVEFMLTKKVKVIVVACNTMSAVALHEINKSAGSIPVINVIDPVVEYLTKQNMDKIGVLGTRATIKSNIYEEKLKKSRKNISVISKSCPLFVPIIEEGFTGHTIADELIREYISDFKNEDLDSLILGCTHYPLISDKISNFLGKKVNIIDSAKLTAKYLDDFLGAEDLKNPNKKTNNEFYFTEVSSSTKNMVNLVFGENYEFKMRTVVID